MNLRESIDNIMSTGRLCLNFVHVILCQFVNLKVRISCCKCRTKVSQMRVM